MGAGGEIPFEAMVDPSCEYLSLQILDQYGICHFSRYLRIWDVGRGLFESKRPNARKFHCFTLRETLMASQGSKDSIGNFRPKRYSDSSAAAYEAAGKTAPEWKIIRDLRLKCIGVIIDDIGGLGESRFKDTA